MLYRIVFISITVSSYAFASFAQFTIPVTTTMHTPYGNVPHTYYVPSPSMYYGTAGTSISAKYEFFVVLKNDSVISGRARIELSKQQDNSITFKNKKEKIKLFPRDTKAIYRYNITNATEQRAASYSITKEKLEGIPANSCWLFKSYAGKINAYSFLAEPGLIYAIAIQEGEHGSIVPIAKENLKAIIGTEDYKLNKLIEKNNFIKAIEMYNTK
jgi:hypothetical protein